MNVDVVINEEVTLADGLVTVAISIPDIGVREVLDLSFGELQAIFGEPDPLALDLLLVAGIVYILDKAVPRRLAEDAWTRDISVTFPVSETARWEAAREQLEECLGFLTGDNWAIDFTHRPVRMYAPSRERRRRPVALRGEGAVTLFSGGLDSLIGTLDWLSDNPRRWALLVGHHDATLPAGDQKRLRDLFNITPYGDRTRLLRMRLRPLPPKLARPGQEVQPARQGREATLRGRSFTFLALGLYAARALGASVPLRVPENGFIAVNIPMTASRIGTCSTRTTHPYFLNLFQSLIGSLGFTNPLDNPLESKTKGETLSACRDQETLWSLAHGSVSCAHPSRRATWQRHSARNCGYCVPCLIRRAAFHHVGRDDGQEYGVDIFTSEWDLDSNVGADTRAVLDCLDQIRAPLEVQTRVRMTGPIGSKFDPLVGVISRGLEELRSLVHDKGGIELQQRAGIR